MKFGLQLLVAVLAVVTFNSIAHATKIPLGPVQMGSGNWYEVVPDIVDYQTAYNAAAAKTLNGLQGHLVTITTAAENTFVAKNLGSFIAAWISASDAAVEGTFRWTAGPESGQAVSYNNFPVGEPNDADGFEDVVEIAYFGGSWNDQNPKDLNCYIVEYELVPEPSTGVLGLAGVAMFARRRRAS